MVKAILSDMCDCIVEQLLNGNKIKLGEFGVFSISINCEGAESLEKFTEENIKSVNIKLIKLSSSSWQAVLVKLPCSRLKRRTRLPLTWRLRRRSLPRTTRVTTSHRVMVVIHQTLAVEAVPTLAPTVAVMVWSRILPVTASCIVQGVVTPSNLCFTFKHISDYEEF
jgi:hypothetical protein